MLIDLGGGRVDGVDNAERREIRFRLHAEQQGVDSVCHFHLASVEDDPLPEASFDVALMNLALHRISQHGPSAQTVLGGMRRLLRPGGRLVICDPLCDPPDQAGQTFAKIMTSMGYELARWEELRESFPDLGLREAHYDTWTVSRIDETKALRRWMHGEDEQTRLESVARIHPPPYAVHVWLGAAILEK